VTPPVSLGSHSGGYNAQTRQIAQILFISQSTAGVHVSDIFGKLGVAGRTEAAGIAIRLGLVPT
jgi:DNA-binding CsgD family transcriptional regulator